MPDERFALLDAMSRPEALAQRSLADWDLLIRQARQAGLLARLAAILEDLGPMAGVPPAPAAHIEAARILAEKHRRDVRWEVRLIADALRPLGIPVILLKGAAYVVTDLPAARGRLFGDIDILVPRDLIAAAEQHLTESGWRPSEVDDWDRRFYRNWMHQIPPMVHVGRKTILDVHHTIVPTTARIDIAAQRLFEAARPIAEDPRLAVLAPADMVLHSATHLFNEGEFDRGLRDVADLDLLLRHFGADAAFWPGLLRRADELDLARPLFYCLRWTARLLATPVPANIMAEAGKLAPPAPLLGIMDTLFARALRPAHASCRDAWSGLALWLLYVRSHHLRMPAHLLVPHLVRKAVKGRLESLGWFEPKAP